MAPRHGDQHRAAAEIRSGLRPLLPRLWRFALLLSRDPASAEDLVQATCLRALERAPQFQPGSRLDRWLFAILRSIWLNEIRARRIREGTGRVEAETVLTADGERLAETNILVSRVLREVLELPEGQREAVVLVYVEGFTYREAAEMLGVPAGTIMSRLAAARAKIGDASSDAATPETSGSRIEET